MEIPPLVSLLAMLTAPIAVATAQTPPPPARETTPPPAAQFADFRLPLLREGSAIAKVVGDLTLDPDEKLWLFRPLEPEAGSVRREFVLMPSPTLEDMLQTERVAGAPVQFEVTGRVFIYRGRNFLMPDFAPTIMRFDTKPGDTPAPTEAAQPTPSGEDRFVAPTDPEAREDAIVDEIERKLEERAGRAPQARTAVQPTARGDGIEQRAPLANGTRITQRLGKLSRDPQTGSWRFVPAQTTGKGDPSIEILPCLLLEKLETATRENDAAPSVLLSGLVYAYEGRNYLLPTSFRRAREGRGIGG